MLMIRTLTGSVGPAQIAMMAARDNAPPPQEYCRPLLEFVKRVHEEHDRFVVAHGADPSTGWTGWSLPDD